MDHRRGGGLGDRTGVGTLRTEPISAPSGGDTVEWKANADASDREHGTAADSIWIHQVVRRARGHPDDVGDAGPGVRLDPQGTTSLYPDGDELAQRDAGEKLMALERKPQ
jgi:hypothetical protein